MQPYLYSLLPFSVSLLFSRLLIPRIQYISVKKRLFDAVTDRKVHEGIIPRLGGVAFFPTFILVSALFLSAHIVWEELFDLPVTIESVKEWTLTLCCGMILYLTGVGDDLIGLRYRQKFPIQIFVGALFILSGLWINNLYGVFGIHEIPFFVGAPLTIFFIVFIVNAMNLIDGIDGLASGLGMITFLFYGCAFMCLRMWFYSLLAFVALGMLVPFFYYNVFGKSKRGHKIFMGDSGSLIIGMLLSVFTLKLCYFEPETITAESPHMIVIACSLLIVPLFDVIRVVVYRLRTGRHPFKPDKNHIHHKFLNLGLSHKLTMIIILLIAIVLVAGNVLLALYVDMNILLLLDIIIWVGMDIILTVKIPKSS